MTICPTCHIEFEPVDYPVVWPWAGSCLCTVAQRESVARERRRAQLQRIELTPKTHGGREVCSRSMIPESTGAQTWNQDSASDSAPPRYERNEPASTPSSPSTKTDTPSITTPSTSAAERIEIG